MENNKTIQTIKGFDNNLKCRDFQYEIGKEYSLPEGEKVETCERGFHAISPDKSPLTVFDYYPPVKDGKVSRYCKVEQSGEMDRNDDKIASSKIKIGAEIGIPGLVKAHVEWVKEHVTNEHNAEAGQPATAGEYGAATAGYRGAATAGEYGAATAGNCGAATAGECGAATAGYKGAATAGECGAATAGYKGAATAGEYGAATAGEGGAATAGYKGAATAGNCGAATAGYRGAATAGEGGAATAGYKGAATAGYKGAATAGNYGAATSRGSSKVGENGLAVARGNNVRVQGGLGAILVIAEEESMGYDIKEWKAVIVDGKNIKADTWYKLVNGELVEVK